MNIKKLMEEYHLEIDDFRWYLALQYARKFLDYKNNLRDLIHYIHSKRLESDLYDMEEKYLMELQSDMDRQLFDESKIREIFTEVLIEKENRFERPFINKIRG